MIGFITSKETAETIMSQVELAQTSRGVPYYWSPGMYEIFSGEHTGSYFIPLTESMLDTVLRNDLKPSDFPEFSQLVSALGGLDARVDLDPLAIQSSDEPEI